MNALLIEIAKLCYDDVIIIKAAERVEIVVVIIIWDIYPRTSLMDFHELVG